MREPVFRIRAAISTCLVTMMLAPLPSLAALTATDAARLDSLEKIVFGSARTNMSEETRLKALETNLFGKAKTGAAKTRLEALSKSMGKAPDYLPPLTAQFDPTGFRHEQPKPSQAASPRVAPEVAPPVTASSGGGISDYSPAPQRQYQTEQASPGDRVKQLLRDALQKHTQGDRQGAQKIFRQVLTIDPQNADANFNLGAMAEDAGDLQGAKRYYSAASAANPGDSDVRDALASVDSRLREQEQARQTAAQVEKKNQLRQVAQDAATAYKAGKYDQAISLLERIDREAPGDANVKYGLGQAYRGKGDLNRARMNLQAAASLDPNNPLYRTAMGELDKQQQAVASNGNSGAPNGGLPPGMHDYGSDNAMPPVADNYPQQGYSQDPAGSLQPFTNDDNGRLYGRATDGRGGISIGGLGGLGSVLGMGGLGLGVGSMMNRNVAYGGGSRSQRLVRGATMGGISGAAIGALTSMGHGPGSVKNGAMKGALYGGLFGLLSGF